MNSTLPRRNRGFTLIELMIGLAMFAILMMLAGPMYQEFMANTQVRNAAESVLAGARYAQSEGIRRNSSVRLVVDKSVGWEVHWVDPETGTDKTIKSFLLTDGSKYATLEPDTGTQVTFTGLGRIQAANDDASAPITRVDVTTSSTPSPRALRVVIGTAGIKLCDPKFAATDPLGCPDIP